eukprot:5050102-Lingulodinium_polyedra.AAC.1
MVQVSRVVVPACSKSERALAAVARRIKNLCARQPEKASGTSQLLSDIFAELRKGSPDGEAAPIPQEMRTFLFSKSAA